MLACLSVSPFIQVMVIKRSLRRNVIFATSNRIIGSHFFCFSKQAHDVLVYNLRLLFLSWRRECSFKL